MPNAIVTRLLVAVAGAVVLPWYGLDAYLPGERVTTGPALYHSVAEGRVWLILPLLPLLAVAALVFGPGVAAAQHLLAPAVLGTALLLLQGFAVIHNGPAWPPLAALLPEGARQPGMGYGAGMLALGYLMLMSRSLAARGYCRGDFFVVAALTLVIALVGIFILFPVLAILASAVQDNHGNFAPQLLIDKLFDRSIWGVDCIAGRLNCGVAWNTLFLGVAVGAATTLLGLAFALLAVRTPFRHKRLLRALTVLPIITPPFVIGLALILLFGRSGLISGWLASLFDVPRSRWIYGFPGVFLAQVLACTPISFLVLIGVLQGIAPSLEEASQTLRASPWATFRTIS